MNFDQAMELLSRDDRFKATISAMNTLLIQKGIYTQSEFEIYFCQWAEAQARRSVNKNGARPTSPRLEPA